MLRTRAYLSAAVLAATLSGFSFAQTDERPKWTETTTIRVKPEKRRQLERCLEQLKAAYRKTATPWFLTFENVAGDAMEYTTVVPVANFGELDGPPAVAKALGEAAWDRLSRDIARCSTAQTRQYATPQHELEINKASVPMGAYWVQTNTRVQPGMMGDYLRWLANDYRPALEKAGVTHFQVSQPIFGADAGEIVTTRMLENLAEIDKGPVLSRALSEEDARAVNARSVALVVSARTRIVRLRTDLSYTAGK